LLRVIDFSDTATILFPQSQILPQSECYRSAPTVEPSAPRNARETMEEALLIVAVIEGVALAGVKVREQCRFKNRLKDILREHPTGVFASPGANQSLSAFQSSVRSRWHRPLRPCTPKKRIAFQGTMSGVLKLQYWGHSGRPHAARKFRQRDLFVLNSLRSLHCSSNRTFRRLLSLRVCANVTKLSSRSVGLEKPGSPSRSSRRRIAPRFLHYPRHQ